MGTSRGTQSSDSDDSVGSGIGNQNMGCSGGVLSEDTDKINQWNIKNSDTTMDVPNCDDCVYLLC